jgi:acylphosphatase
MIRHLAIRVLGKVQNVGFEYGAALKAQFLNLSGFYRNNPDGTVELEVEGDSHSLEHFLEWCKKGPIRARVEKVYVNEGRVVDYNKFYVN